MPARTSNFRLIIIIMLLATSGVQAAPSASQGVLDLTAWDLRTHGIATLDGEWEFYGNVLLHPEEFDSLDVPYAPTWVRVPGPWNRYPSVSSAPMGSDGYATYRLQILLPNGTHTTEQEPAPDELAIYIPYVNTSYVLWVDGEPVARNGTLAQSRSEGKPQFRPEIVYFHPQDRQVELVLHVSNFHFRNGGVPRSLEIGSADQMTLRQRRLEATSATQFGAVFIMSLFFAGIYALRRENVSDALFSLFLFTIAARILVTGDHILARVTSELPWEITLKVEYFTTYLSPAIFLYYLRSLFPEDVSNLVVRLKTFCAFAGAAATLVLPGRLSSHLIPPYLFVQLGFYLYFIYVAIRAAAQNRSDAKLFLAGIIAAVLCAKVTTLRYAGISSAPDLIPLGITLLTLVQCLILAMRSARSHRQTVAYAAENARMLAETEWQLKKLKEYRRLMTLREEQLRRRLAEILHGRTQGRLFATGRLIDRATNIVQEAPAKARAYLSDARSLLEQVREEDIRHMGKQLHPSAVGAGIVAAAEALLDTFRGSYRVEFEVDPKVDEMDQAQGGGLPYDLRLGIYRILEEGLNNISRHANAQTIRLAISFEPHQSGDSIRLILADDGVGFEPTQASDGLGLPTIDARVGDLGGTWSLSGSPGKGAVLDVSIPLPQTAASESTA